MDLSLGGPPVAADISALSSSRRAGILGEYPSQFTFASASPKGYSINERRKVIGRGATEWSRAAKGVETGDVLDLSWARFWRKGRGSNWSPGDVVVVGARVLPAVWVANVNRVVGVERRRNRVAVAWGTTARHVLRGEEVVSVERVRGGDVVFSLRSFSRPNAFLAWLGYPLVVLLQRRFAHDVCARMQQIAKQPDD